MYQMSISATFCAKPRRGVNTNENLILLWNRFFDFLELKHIGRPIFCVDNRLHARESIILRITRGGVR